MERIARYILARLSEKTTIAGGLIALGSLGINLEPGLAEALGSAITGAAGVALVLLPEPK